MSEELLNTPEQVEETAQNVENVAETVAENVVEEATAAAEEAMPETEKAPKAPRKMRDFENAYANALENFSWDKVSEQNDRYSKEPIEEAILANGIGMFAICSESENGFAYWIAGLYQGGEVPEGLELYSFPASEWAVFSTKGPIPSSLQALNTYVWQEWFPTEGKKYHANGSATLEVYSAGDPQSLDYESGIWVPVQEA